MPKDDSLVSYSAQFLSENLTVVLINFYVNFLSSRKYDWNVAPKDLEKIRRAHGACVVFFLKKKMKVYLLQLLLLKIIKQENKKYFSTCLLFYFLSCSYYYYNTIKQSTLCSTLIVFYLLLLSLERCQEKFFENILSLLAGKSEQICTAFPLTTISAQKIISFFLQQKF